jgi:hypothetical protein
VELIIFAGQGFDVRATLVKFFSVSKVLTAVALDAAHMTIDALRRELLEERIRQQFIVAELAKRRELEDEFRARFRQTKMPLRGTSPLPDGESFDMPLSLAGASMSRRPVKDRIEEWYQPPWCRTIDEEDAPIVRVSGCLSFICLILFSFTFFSSLCICFK